MVESYPRHYAPGDSIVSHLRFMLRREAFDLRVLAAAFKSIDPAILEDWVRSEPTGAYSRRAWFFYETLTGQILDLGNVRSGNYVEALDPKKFIVAARRNSRRHRVIDNLLGGPGLCVTVRRTPRQKSQMESHLDEEARRVCENVDPLILIRAVNYLYTKETRSSFAIEGERPSSNRSVRFVASLRAAATFDPLDKSALVDLQGTIVDPRYAATDWRQIQNFVGRTAADYSETIDFICPRPKDVPGLMEGWMALTRRVVKDDIPPIAAAAASAFAFVFIHPFEDGNGRIHRFLVHHILASSGFSPRDVIFPVSAAILRDRRGYDEVLETFSRPLLEFIAWHWTPQAEVVVENETRDLYGFVDMTDFAEYLHDRVAETIRRDLKEELGFIAMFDHALNAVREIVDMPDRRASLLVRLCMQNNGRLAARERSHFPELSDGEIASIEAAVQDAAEAGPSDTATPAHSAASGSPAVDPPRPPG